MTKQTNGSNRNGQKGDPNRDMQPWMGWIAAMFVVVIVVVAVALGVERTRNQSRNTAEVRMTPLVGGMEVPVATETNAAVGTASEVTPLPQAISESATISMVTVITATSVPTDTFPATGEMTPTETLTATAPLTATEGVTTGTELTPTIEATVVPTATSEATVEPTVAVTEAAAVQPTPEATASPTSRPTVQPSATPRSTATALPTATVGIQEFEVGDVVVANGGRVEIYADVSQDALILDSFGSAVTLEVLDPSGDYTEYPVVVDGIDWVRVRAPDGLVGWVMGDQVEAQ